MQKTSRTYLVLAAGFVLGLSLVGAGCGASSSPTQQMPSDVVTGPKKANFENVSPQDATKKIVLVPGTVLTTRQQFQDKGQDLAKSLGWGNTVERDLVVKRFAPGNFAEIDWKLKTSVPTKDGKTENRQQSGNIAGFDIKQSPDVLSPSLWMEGNRNAGGASGIWLSANVFENLSKNQASTLRFSMTNAQVLDLLGLPTSTKAQFDTYRKNVVSIGSKKDIEYATAGADPIRVDINANGSRVTVEALQVTSWYGKLIVLNNPQNPLILKFTPSKEFEAATISGYFGFEVTDIKDIDE